MAGLKRDSWGSQRRADYDSVFLNVITNTVIDKDTSVISQHNTEPFPFSSASVPDSPKRELCSIYLSLFSNNNKELLKFQEKDRSQARLSSRTELFSTASQCPTQA